MQGHRKHGRRTALARRTATGVAAALLLALGGLTASPALAAPPDPAAPSSHDPFAALTGTSAVTGTPLTAPTPDPLTPDPLTAEAAHAQAAVLAQQVSALELRVEQAAEDHDAAEASLVAVVAAQVRAQEALTAAQQALSAQRAASGARARAVQHDGGGQLGLVAGVLRGRSPADVLDGYQAVSTLIGDDGSAVTAARHRLTQADDAATAVLALRTRQLAAESAAAESQQAATDALAQRSALLANADAHVAQLAEQASEQAEQADLDDASSSIAALGADPSAAAASPAAAAAIASARTRLGDPYLWGATGPDSFDCSGLVQWAYAQVGVSLPRTTKELYAALPQVPVADIAPGDLVLFATDVSDPSTIHHVGLYIGGGLMIHAPHTGDVVRVAAVTRHALIAVVRPPAPPAP